MKEAIRTIFGNPKKIRVAVYDLEKEEDYLISFSVDHTGEESIFNVVIGKVSSLEEEDKTLLLNTIKEQRLGGNIPKSVGETKIPIFDEISTFGIIPNFYGKFDREQLEKFYDLESFREE